jgi:hypothetical protein
MMKLVGPPWTCRRALQQLLLCAALPAVAAAAAADLYRYADADLALGEALIRQHRCEACHARQVGGDGTDIYRPSKRISNPGALRGMVEMCSVELKLQLFPEEITAVAAVLQRDHYRFLATKAKP